MTNNMVQIRNKKMIKDQCSVTSKSSVKKNKDHLTSLALPGAQFKEDYFYQVSSLKSNYGEKHVFSNF